MDKIVSNPGFQHLAEKVFRNLDIENLKLCAQINQSWTISRAHEGIYSSSETLLKKEIGLK